MELDADKLAAYKMDYNDVIRAIKENNSRFENGSRKLIIVDIAVPRDAEIGDKYRHLIEVYHIEDVQRHIVRLLPDIQRSKNHRSLDNDFRRHPRGHIPLRPQPRP